MQQELNEEGRNREVVDSMVSGLTLEIMRVFHARGKRKSDARATVQSLLRSMKRRLVCKGIGTTDLTDDEVFGVYGLHFGENIDSAVGTAYQNITNRD